MRIAAIVFTQRGLDLAQGIAQSLAADGHEVETACGFGEKKVDHFSWVQEHFGTCDALVFVGAVGIAVRTIAPLLQSKASDPAVIAIDDHAGFCIPLVSGHIGGANQLAQHIAQITGAQPVVTTATDIAGLFAVDAWAVSQGLVVRDIQRIKLVSSKLLAGEGVTCSSQFPIRGSLPQGVEMVPIDGPDPTDQASSQTSSQIPDFHVGIGAIDAQADVLNLIAPVVTLGVGCRRGTPQETIEKAFNIFLDSQGIDPLAMCQLASIDLKADEEGLLAFASSHNLPLKTFTAEELNALEGEFASSGFVNGVTGTDNVCERAAAAAVVGQPGGRVIVHKTIVEGMTLAAALYEPDLQWPSASGVKDDQD